MVFYIKATGDSDGQDKVKKPQIKYGKWRCLTHTRVYIYIYKRGKNSLPHVFAITFFFCFYFTYALSMYLQYWHSIGVDIYDKDAHVFLKYLQSCYSDIYETLRAKTPIAPLSMDKSDRRIPTGNNQQNETLKQENTTVSFCKFWIKILFFWRKL